MSWGLPPMQSRLRARLLLQAKKRGPANSNAAGSATSYQMRFASLSSTISGCAMLSAGRYSTADPSDMREAHIGPIVERDLAVCHTFRCAIPAEKQRISSQELV